MIEDVLYDTHLHSYTNEDSALSHVTDLPFTIKQWGDGEYFNSIRSSANLPFIDKPI